MVRAALSGRTRIGREPAPYAPYVPAATVVVGSLLAALPIISMSGWYPDFGFVVLISWRLLRADPWPAWWAAPLGLINDLFTGLPIGFSVALWSATMLLLDLIDRRTMWRDLDRVGACRSVACDRPMAAVAARPDDGRRPSEDAHASAHRHFGLHLSA